MISEQELQSLGWNRIHWNPKFNGGFFEYWVLLSAGDQAPLRLSVRFDGNPRYGRRFMVYLVSGEFSQTMVALWNITTMEQLQALRSLLSGVTVWSIGEVSG